MKVLILGGTSEAAQLAELIGADTRFEPTLSLAGRTASPRRFSIPARIGGFGGADAMARWLDDNGIEAVVDATHPFAAQISRNAVAASARAHVPFGSLVRAPWAKVDGDRWTEVESAEAAVAALGEKPRRVFLSVGRLELPRFAAAPQHRYLARTIDVPDRSTLPPFVKLIRERGPFDIAAERRLLQAHGIEVVVSKHSGGEATYAKIAAARELGLPVILILRPDKPAGIALDSPQAALAWLEMLLRERHGQSSERGV